MAPPLLLSLLALGAHAVRLPAEAGTLQLLNFMKQPPIRDGGAVHLSTVACANCKWLRGLLVSTAAQARLEGGVKPFFHVITDKGCTGFIHSMMQSEPKMLEFLDARFYDIDSIPKQLSHKSPHGKPCMSVRLFLPRLFPLLQRLIYLDTDTLVLNSFKPLWHMSVPVVAMADDNRGWLGNTYVDSISKCPTWRNGTKAVLQGSVIGAHPKCWVGDHGLNSGVMLFNLTGWRAHNFDREVDWWTDQVYRGEVDVLQNDQDILNMILVPHEEYVAELPCEANLRMSHRWMCLFSDGSWKSLDNNGNGVLQRNERRPIVLHSKFGLDAVRQDWGYLFNRTMTLARLVNVDGLKNGSSLCDVVDCQHLVLEQSHDCDRCQPGRTPQQPCFCSSPLRDFVEDQTYPHTH